MTDHDVVAALDLDLPALRPEFRARLIALIDDPALRDPETSGTATAESPTIEGGFDPTTEHIVDLAAARSKGQQRRRWLAPIAVAATVAALIGTWALVTSPQETDPASPTPNTTAIADTSNPAVSSASSGLDTPAPAESATSELPQPTALPGCPAVDVVTVTAADGARSEMALTSYNIIEPRQCRQTSFQLDLLLAPPAGGVIVTSADSLAISGTPAGARVLYGTYVMESEGAPRALGEGMLTDDPTEPFGFGTTTAPFERVIVREIPLSDEPCITVVVRWSTLELEGAGIIHVARTPDACDPAG